MTLQPGDTALLHGHAVTVKTVQRSTVVVEVLVEATALTAAQCRYCASADVQWGATQASCRGCGKAWLLPGWYMGG